MNAIGIISSFIVMDMVVIVIASIPVVSSSVIVCMVDIVGVIVIVVITVIGVVGAFAINCYQYVP